MHKYIDTNVTLEPTFSPKCCFHRCIVQASSCCRRLFASGEAFRSLYSLWVLSKKNPPTTMIIDTLLSGSLLTRRCFVCSTANNARCSHHRKNYRSTLMVVSKVLLGSPDFPSSVFSRERWPFFFARVDGLCRVGIRGPHVLLVIGGVTYVV